MATGPGAVELVEGELQRGFRLPAAGVVVFGEQQAKDEGFDPVTATIRQRSRAHGYPGGAPVQVHLVADRETGLLLGGEDLLERLGAAENLAEPAGRLVGVAPEESRHVELRIHLDVGED